MQFMHPKPASYFSPTGIGEPIVRLGAFKVPFSPMLPASIGIVFHNATCAFL